MQTNPEQWAMDLWKAAFAKAYNARPTNHEGAAALIQAAFAERESRLVGALEAACKAADVILAPICATSGRYLYDYADCPDMIEELSGEGVVIPAKDFADLYEATHPTTLAALKDRTHG